MAMRIALLALVGILAITSVATAECERRYTYGLSEDTKTIYVPVAGSKWGTIELGSDVVMSHVEFCGTDSDYYCFLPYFAVPKQLDGSVKHWTVGDRTFEVVTSGGVLQALGTRIDGLFSIQPSPQLPDKFERYYFSPRSGLVGIEWGNATYWLREKSGFGASQPDPSTLVWKKEKGTRDRERCPKD